LIPGWVDYAVVGLVSGGVGVSELVERFRDAPLRALRTRPAWAYIALNIAAGELALLIIQYFGFTFGTDTSGKPLRWTQGMVAAFSAIVFLRSSVFVVSQEDTDKGYGPGLLFERLLRASVDRIDRIRGSDRADEVSKAVKGLYFGEAVEALPPLCYAMLPNATEASKQQLANAVADLRKSDLRDEVKLRLLGQSVMIFGGSPILQKATAELRAAQRT
jgi:hypothetical protein